MDGWGIWVDRCGWVDGIDTMGCDTKRYDVESAGRMGQDRIG